VCTPHPLKRAGAVKLIVDLAKGWGADQHLGKMGGAREKGTGYFRVWEKGGWSIFSNHVQKLLAAGVLKKYLSAVG
jgi:hypothetical protein